MNRLAILDKDLEFSRKLLNYVVKENKKIRLFKMAVNLDEMMETLDELDEKDILILDLNLQGDNGLEILDKLKRAKKPIPYIIVTTSDKELYGKLTTYSEYVYTTIVKPFELKAIVDIIEQITCNAKEEYFEKITKEELSKFEINITTWGYTYIVDAIVLSLQDENLLKDLQKGLFKAVYEKHNRGKICNVKWAVEKCIKATIRYTDTNVTNTYFHVQAREKITPKLFITMVIYNIKERMQEEIEA